MIETICRLCGERYQPSTDHVCAKRPAKKSTAARKDVQRGATRPAPGTVEAGQAGTQAPPVDTLRKAEAAAAHLAPKRGRPKIHPDRKLYKAQMERKRRAAKKAGKP